MKRLLVFILSFCLIFGLSACGGKENDNDKNTVDLEYYASLGQIPECEYTLGEDTELIKKAFSDAAEQDEESVYYFDEGEENALIDNGIYNFYYKKSNEEQGISFIVSYETAYGFELGTVDIEIKDAISEIDYTVEELNQENAFFLWGAEEGSIIKCKFEKNTVIFVFEDNALCATAIYNNSDWE